MTEKHFLKSRKWLKLNELSVDWAPALLDIGLFEVRQQLANL